MRKKILGVKDLERSAASLQCFPCDNQCGERPSCFLRTCLKENLPATELLTAKYTFLDQRLADWYGIDGVKGSQMRKVNLPSSTGSRWFAAAGDFSGGDLEPDTDLPGEARPLFVLENLAGHSGSSCGAGCPAFGRVAKGCQQEFTAQGNFANSQRRSDLCFVSCADGPDWFGSGKLQSRWALWRDNYRGQPIDTEGELVTGEKFKNAEELAKILASSRYRDFHRALTEKLLTYAIGRGMEYYDAPTIDRIVKNMEKRGSRIERNHLWDCRKRTFSKAERRWRYDGWWGEEVNSV